MTCIVRFHKDKLVRIYHSCCSLGIDFRNLKTEKNTMGVGSEKVVSSTTLDVVEDGRQLRDTEAVDTEMGDNSET